jgi:MoaA/NifB/PqqE/SkfB family radical SAM enzyme
MSSPLARIGETLGRMLRGPDQVEMTVGPEGPRGDLLVPSAGDGVWEVTTASGRPCLTPDESSYYLYCVLPSSFRGRARGGLWVEVEYHGERWGEFRVQYASTDRGAEEDGLYKPAEQRFRPDTQGLRRFRRAIFRLPDFDPDRTQNEGASFRLEFRRELLVSRVAVTLEPPALLAELTGLAPTPELRKMPGRFYPINYLFIEITNACNFKCTWCPDDKMDRRRGFMKKEKVFRVLDEIAEKRSWLGPLYPVKLHQMGEPMLHPDLAEIVAHAESRGVGIELNTNCGLITREKIDGLFQAGLTNLILSYQTPDLESFKTRKAPRLVFDEYRDKVRLAIERKVALRARTNIEIDIMNTKHADGYRIVSEDEQALAFLTDWIAFCQELESRHGLVRRPHDLEAIRAAHVLDQDENGSRYTLLDGVHLIWKRCHSWGNVIGEHTTITPNPPGAFSPDANLGLGGTAHLPADAPRAAGARPEEYGEGAPAPPPSTYCPAPYDQFVVQWNGDVVSCCTDYEGRTKTANVFASSVEGIWRSEVLKQRKKDMLAGRLLDVCARCQGLK